MINGRIGASAVTVFSPWPRACALVAREKRACIGSDKQFTVYFGELYGLLMALDLVVEDNRLGLNNQFEVPANGLN